MGAELSISSKVCRKCMAEKSISEFFINKRYSDGHVNHCKDCLSNYQKSRWVIVSKDRDFMSSELARARQRTRDGKNSKNSPVKARILSMGYRAKYPEKYKAHRAIAPLQRTEGRDRHHWSYNEPHWKDTIELPPMSHAKAHRFLIYDQPEMMYRRKDTGELLDTRQKHAGKDGDCIWKHCPQNNEGEPDKTGRHCPLDIDEEN